MNAKNNLWFESAMKTSSGKEFGFQTVSKCPLVNNEHTLVFSCTIRKDGDQNGSIIGVLGAIFRWEDLAQKIVKGIPISDEEGTEPGSALLTIAVYFLQILKTMS